MTTAGRSVGAVKQFVKRQAQQIAVYGGHAFQAPVLRVLAHPAIKDLHLRDRTFKKGARKALHVRINLLRLQEAGNDVLRGVSSQVPLEEHL